MNELQTILSRLDDLALTTSPYLRGDTAAARFAGFKTAKTFLKWAVAARVKPSRADGLNTWSKRDIDKAIERGKI
jgi:hypothetical protein